MDTKELQAWKRIAKKLSALRATLRADERIILDRLIIGAAGEVELHSVTPAVQPRVTPVIQPRVTPAVQPRVTPRIEPNAGSEGSEVEMHRVTPAGQIAPKVTPRVTPRLMPQADVNMVLTPEGEYSVEKAQP
jgi:hypothetical protein